MNVDTFLGAFVTNVLAGVAFAILLYFFQQLRYCWFLRRVYNGGEFEIREKGDRNGPPIRTARLEVRGSKISFRGSSHNKNNPQGGFNGNFIMNIVNLKIGEGVHYHDGYDGFNFPRIFIKDRDTFYEDTVYISKRDGRFEQHAQAFVWTRKKTGVQCLRT